MTKDQTFTKSLERLEQIVARLESQELDLEEAMQLLAEGISLHKKCSQKLKNAQEKIDKMSKESEVN